MIILYLNYYKQFVSNEKKANILFNEIILSKQNTFSNLDQIIEKHKIIIKKYPKTRSAILSYYRIALIFSQLNNIDNAILYYKMFLKNTNLKTNDFLFITYLNLGYCYEIKSDFHNALDNFFYAVKIITKNNIDLLNKCRVYLSIARILEKLGKNKEAISYYNFSLENKNDRNTEILIRKKIALLNDKI